MLSGERGWSRHTVTPRLCPVGERFCGTPHCLLRSSFLGGCLPPHGVCALLHLYVGRGCANWRMYGRCSKHVHDMERWLVSIHEVVGVGRWILLRDWNAHHRPWSLKGRSGLSGGVLQSWMQERGAELVKGGENTFKCTCRGVSSLSNRLCGYGGWGPPGALGNGLGPVGPLGDWWNGAG